MQSPRRFVSFYTILLYKYIRKSFTVRGEPVEPPFDELRVSGFLSVHAEPEARQAQCERETQTNFRLGT